LGVNNKFGKIIKLPTRLKVGATGSFYFDVKNNKSYWDRNLYPILGEAEGENTFENIVKLVDVKDRTKFQEMSVGHKGKETKVETSPILMRNGNTIIETYNFLISPEHGLYGIVGNTELVAVA
jgi:hypothetical protein